MAEKRPVPLNDAWRERYVQRLGFHGPPTPGRDGLTALHRAHLHSLPFENLDIHLGRPIRLDLDGLVEKLLGRNRGGYCYELNGAFGSLLASLGFDVSILEARVYGGDAVGIRFDHACLRVLLDKPVLVDVGFGASFQEPLALEPGVDQLDPGGTYRLVERPDGWLDLEENGAAQYRLSLRPRSLDEFSGANGYHQTSRESHFTQNTVCSLATEQGRITIRGLRFVETIGGVRSEKALTPDELGPLLETRFGIVLSDAELEKLASSD